MENRHTRVMGVEGSQVVVGIEADSACSACRSRTLCGSGTQAQVRLEAPGLAATLRPGDAVALGVDDDVPMRAALLAYLPPMLGLLGGMVPGMIAGLPDGGLLVCALAGLVAGSTISRFGARRWERRWQLRIQPRSD